MRAGALGDMLLLRPLVHALRARFERVDLLAPETPGAALVGSGPADVALLVAWDAAAQASLFRDDPLPAAQARWLRGYAAAVVISRNRPLIAHVDTHIGERSVIDPAPPPGMHASDHYRASAAGTTGTPPPACVPDEEETRAASRHLRSLPPRFVAVHPGSGSTSKNWPASCFATLVGKLTEGGPFAVIEGPADAEPCAALRRLSGARVVRGARPRVLGAVLSRAGLFVGNDSGVSHLAAAWGAPVLGLFGPTDPAQWSPRGRRVATLRAPGSDLTRLSVGCVERAARRLYRAAENDDSPTTNWRS